MNPTWVEYANGETLLLILKLFYLLLFGLYFVFAMVVFVQIKGMLVTLNGSADKLILMIGIIHLVLAGAALLAAFVIL